MAQRYLLGCRSGLRAREAGVLCSRPRKLDTLGGGRGRTGGAGFTVTGGGRTELEPDRDGGIGGTGGTSVGAGRTRGTRSRAAGAGDA